MLKIIIPESESFDSEKEEFIQIKETSLQLEHSLVSISKWESKWHKPFLDKNYKKTSEEVIDYIRCMTITQNVDPNIYYSLTNENMKAIDDYINDSMTATWFSDKHEKNRQQSVITSEIIYYWMIALNIPVEFQKWHLNRLLTLIKVCNEKNQPDKKVSKNAIRSQNRALNAARRKKLKSKG